MGTYGVTHVKSANSILAFSDSYDGYMGGGMGQANMLCIKYLSTPILRQLFDKFTASKKVAVDKVSEEVDESDYDEDGDEQGLSQRAIQDVVFRVKQDTGSDEAAEWMTDILSHTVRASMCGFAPLLYLNINNHYGRNYDYCDFMVDLDLEHFEYNGIRIAFAQIRAASQHQINALCNEMSDFLPEALQEAGTDIFDGDYRGEAGGVPQEVTDAIHAYLSIDDAVLEAHSRKEEEEREQRLAQYQQRNDARASSVVNKEEEDGTFGAYSIRNGETTVPSLRAIVALMQKLKTTYPECSFLTTTGDWGANEDFTAAGVRMFSPMSQNKITQAIFELFAHTLEQQFQMRFSMFSSTGRWSHDVVRNPDEPMDMFARVVPGPVKSVYSIADVNTFEHGEEILRTVDPFLSLHGDYTEVRCLLLSDSVAISAPIIWVYMALLYQDAPVFSKVYPAAREVMATLDDKTREAAYGKYLQCVVDAQVINGVVAQVGQIVGQGVDPTENERFTAYLKTTPFFADCEPYMNSAEKALYAA